MPTTGMTPTGELLDVVTSDDVLVILEEVVTVEEIINRGEKLNNIG